MTGWRVCFETSRLPSSVLSSAGQLWARCPCPPLRPQQHSSPEMESFPTESGPAVGLHTTIHVPCWTCLVLLFLDVCLLFPLYITHLHLPIPSNAILSPRPFSTTPWNQHRVGLFTQHSHSLHFACLCKCLPQSWLYPPSCPQPSSVPHTEQGLGVLGSL